MDRVCTVQTRAVNKIVTFAQTYGVGARALYEAVKLDPRTLSNPDGRMPFAQLVLLYEKAAALTGDDIFGLRLGERIDPKVFDVLGYSAMNSLTLGDALNRVARYHSIWTDGAAIDVNHRDGQTTLAYRYLDHSLGACRQDTEMTLAAMVALSRQITQADWSPLAVKFRHAAPGNTAEHERIFRASIQFNAGCNELVLHSGTLALPIAKADLTLGVVLDRHAEELLERFPRPDGITDRVRHLIKEELNGGDPSLERVADKLGLSGRTLQRRLHEQGTAHHELLDQMRKELAMRYLREPEMAVCEVAYLLGFSESSSLHRAFKRWTGQTPNEFRRG